MIEYLRQLFCNHDFTTTVGTGIYEKKKNHEPLVMYPVLHMVCTKCGFEDNVFGDIFIEKEVKKNVADR